MDMKSMTLEDFTEALASKQAVPGGGGASALTASLAAALGCMVGELTVGKKKYAANEPELRELMARAAVLRARLLELIEDDAAAFEPLARAYAIPKDEPERDEIMEKCLLAAAGPPMEILELSCEIIVLQEGFARLGSDMAVSDAGTGAVLAWSAMYAAALNVLANTRSMKDRARAEAMNARVKELMDSHWKLADRVYEEVYGKLSL